MGTHRDLYRAPLVSLLSVVHKHTPAYTVWRNLLDREQPVGPSCNERRLQDESDGAELPERHTARRAILGSMSRFGSLPEQFHRAHKGFNNLALPIVPFACEKGLPLAGVGLFVLPQNRRYASDSQVYTYIKRASLPFSLSSLLPHPSSFNSSSSF